MFVNEGQHAKQGTVKSLWHLQHGEVNETLGSTHLTVGLLTAVDMIVLPVILFVYAFIAELIAYWNVCFRGNQIEYVTASKAAQVFSDGATHGTVHTDLEKKA